MALNGGSKVDIYNFTRVDYRYMHLLVRIAGKSTCDVASAPRVEMMPSEYGTHKTTMARFWA
jgi:hypothetical protein